MALMEPTKMEKSHVSFWNNAAWGRVECVNSGFMESELWLVALYLTYLVDQLPGEPLTIPGLIDLQGGMEEPDETVVLSTVQTRRLRRYVEGFEFEDLMEQYRESAFYQFWFVEDEDGGHAGLLEKFTEDLKQCERVVFISADEETSSSFGLRYAENIIQSINRESRIIV